MKCEFTLVENIDDTKGLYKCGRCHDVIPMRIGLGEKVSRKCPISKVDPQQPCIYRGKVGAKLDCGCSNNARTVACECPGNQQKRALLSAPRNIEHKFGEWVCSTCPHRCEATAQKHDFPAITVRNLIYHCCPLKSNNLWRNNVRQLLDNREVFNGRKLIAVSTGDGMHDIQEVRTELGGFAELLPIPNDKQLREVVSFLPLLCGVANTNTNEATFYAHTKGNSTADSVEGATYWRNAGYRHLLGGSDACMEHLRRFKAVGIHKMVYPDKFSSPYPTKLAHGRWMFAGTFFWFRNDAVFNKLRWREVPIDRYGAEAWLAGLFEPNEAKSVYQKWDEEKWTMPNPYNPALYKDDFITDDEVERLRIERCAKESRPRLAL